MKINNVEDFRLEKDALQLIQLNYAMFNYFVFKNNFSKLQNLSPDKKKELFQSFDASIDTIHFLRKKLVAIKKATNERGESFSFPMDIDLPEAPPQVSSDQSNQGCTGVVAFVILVIVVISMMASC